MVNSSGDSVSVRAARAEDEAALAALETAAWTPESGFPSVIAKVGQSFFSEANPPDAHLVAETDGEVAGYIRLRPVTSLPENAHVLGVQGLAVAPQARRRGVAGALLAAAEGHARRRGARKLSLRVLGTNEPAMRVYERLGFRREGTLRGEFLIEGRYVDDVIMAKYLDGPPQRG